MTKKNVKQLMEKWLRDLIRIDTQNPPGHTKEAVEYIQGIAAELGGINCKILAIDDHRQNVIWTIGEATNRKIVLSGHLDTVPVGNLDFWDFDPFSAKKLDSDRIGGRGAADMKAGVITNMGIITMLLDEIESLPCQITFVGTADEEVSMQGARTVRDEVMKDAEFLFITEPTNGMLGIAEKGVLQLKVEFIGNAAHGSMPEQGINAIMTMNKFLQQFNTILPKNHHPLLNRTTFNVGRINGGTKVNIVADTCWSEIDIRFIPGINSNELLQRTKKLLAVMNHDFGTTSNYKILHQLPALETSKIHPLISFLMKKLNKYVIGLTYATDAAELLTGPFQQVPFAIIGPGDPNVIHQPNEFVSMTEIVIVTEILTNAIKQFNIL